MATVAPARPTTDDPPPPRERRPLFVRLAGFSARHRRGVIVTWLLVVIAAAPLFQHGIGTGILGIEHQGSSTHGHRCSSSRCSSACPWTPAVPARGDPRTL